MKNFLKKMGEGREEIWGKTILNGFDELSNNTHLYPYAKV